MPDRETLTVDGLWSVIHGLSSMLDRKILACPSLVQRGVHVRFLVAVAFDLQLEGFDPLEQLYQRNSHDIRQGSVVQVGRVGCLVLSPYARRGHVSKIQHSHVSLVRFCEVNFGLPSLNARTAASDGMEDCFDFAQAPLPPPQ